MEFLKFASIFTLHYVSLTQVKTRHRAEKFPRRMRNSGPVYNAANYE
jgi:hypothetical protein